MFAFDQNHAAGALARSDDPWSQQINIDSCRPQLTELLYRLFDRKTHYTIKELMDLTQQPLVFLSALSFDMYALCVYD